MGRRGEKIKVQQTLRGFVGGYVQLSADGCTGLARLANMSLQSNRQYFLRYAIVANFSQVAAQRSVQRSY